jgi:hypothetical protein
MTEYLIMYCVRRRNLIDDLTRNFRYQWDVSRIF